MFQTHYNANEKIWSGLEVDSNVDESQNFGEIILKTLNDVGSSKVMQVKWSKIVRHIIECFFFCKSKLLIVLHSG